jgi:3',5'-nucleoside bisphosphate phosphatase
MLSDLHLHSTASDGELDPASVVEQAAARGVSRLAITDHDTLAAYRWRDGAVFEAARAREVELTVGIELDVSLDGRELHLLGLALELDNPALTAHLEAVREARHERARRELALVNERFGAGTLREDQVFVPDRASLMRPHLIRPLVAQGRFASYREGQAWFHENATTGVVLPRPEIGAAIELVHAAGGWAALAHPGYYWKRGFPLLGRLAALRAAGLDAVELDYPYASSSPGLFAADELGPFTAALREAGESHGLRFTRGSDAHTAADFARVYGSPAA